MTTEINKEKRTQNHNIRNQLSNIVMMVTELKCMKPSDQEERNALYETIEQCCRNIENLLAEPQ